MVKRPLRNTVGAHYGSMEWLAQRVTAVVMVVYTFGFLGVLLWHGGLDYATWNGLFASNLFRLLSFLFMVALLYHAWIGVRDIYMDYLKSIGLRLFAQVVSIAVLVAYLGWAIQILWGVR
ncbi:MAG: succinate dehydrogenase, hydrophobic membrane anchor protein [Casimicrobiaceae bacterium]